MSPKRFTREKIKLLEVTKYKNFTKLRVLRADTYVPGHSSCGGTVDIVRFFCKKLWTFALIFAIFIIFMYVVRNWGLCPLFMAFGFVVGREDRIKRKLEAWSKLVDEFDKKLEVTRTKGTWLCPKCFSEDIINKERPRPEKGYLGRLKCKSCGHKFRREVLPIGVKAPARIVNHIVRLIVLGVPVQDVASVVSATARDFGFNYKVGRSTVYYIIRKVVEVVEWLDRFVAVGLLEGVPCERLECDEIFQRRVHRCALRKYLESEDAYGTKVPRFFYIINAVSVENHYPLPPEVAEARNKSAFTSFVLKIGPYLRNVPQKIYSDELKPLISSLKARFLGKEPDTTKRRGARKTMMDRTAHVERLNRQYRKTLPKNRKVGGRMVTVIKAKLCRFNICYCSADRKVVEALEIPWPDITTISELILFAKFVQKNAKKVLGDEAEVFESPIIGRCVLTISFDSIAYSLVKQRIATDEWFVFGLNAWIPHNKRSKVIKDLLDGKIIACRMTDDGNIKVTINVHTPLAHNLYVVKVILDDEHHRIHFIGDLLAGPYQIVMIPLAGHNKLGALLLERVWVDAGKVNHHVFTLTIGEMLEQIGVVATNSLVYEELATLSGKIKIGSKLLGDVYLAGMCETGENVLCPSEIEVPVTPWLRNLYFGMSKEIELLTRVAEHFDAKHLVSIAIWFANETLLRGSRPHSVSQDPFAIKWLLAALYKVLEKILGTGPDEYGEVLKSFGIELGEIEKYTKTVETLMPKTFESLFMRLICAKSPLDANIKIFHDACSSLSNPAST